jgi:phospholipid-binding lipoprotein MlaA
VASPQPPALAGDATPQVILVSDPGIPAGADPSPATPSEGEVLTPEAAQILKEHGYDLSDLLRNQSGSLQTAQLLRESLDPLADKDGTDSGEIEEYDPWEKVNVVTFEFNYKLDKYVVKPVAKGYNFIMPDIAQRGIFNFFQNIRFVPRLLNNVFQAKFKGAGIESGRFLINTTLGIGGLFDPAKAWFNLETPVEDTGQTFGRYGAKPGPYIVFPFLGSFTLRDGIGYLADLALDPFNWFVLPIIKLGGAPKLVTHNDTIAFAQLGMRAGQIVNDRSLNLEKFQGVEEATLDLYSAVRNAYLQQRAKLIRE